MREDLVNVYKYLRGGYQQEGARLFSVLPGNRQRGSKLKLKHRKLYLHILHCEGDRVLGQTAHRCCRVSFSGDIQTLPGYDPRQCTLGYPI